MSQSLHQRQPPPPPPPPPPPSGEDPWAPPYRHGPTTFRQRYAAVFCGTGLLFLLSLLVVLGVLSPWAGRGLPAGLLAGSKPVVFPADWRDYTLAEAAAFVAKNGTIVVCTASQPYLPMLSNWLISIGRQRQEEKVLVVAEDYATLYRVNDKWPGHAVLIPPAPDAQGAHNFHSQGFFNVTSRRPRHLLQVLEMGYNVFYNDVDMVWLADPFAYFEGNHDVYITDDMPFAKPLNNHPHGLPVIPRGEKATYLCSCIIFLRPTSGAKALVRTWIEKIQSEPWTKKRKTHDQRAFNWALNKTAHQVDVYVLPQAGFPPGALYFRNKTWARETKGRQVIVHNNYIVGIQNKIKRFRDYGLWMPDGCMDVASPLGRGVGCEFVTQN